MAFIYTVARETKRQQLKHLTKQSKHVLVHKNKVTTTENTSGANNKTTTVVWLGWKAQ